MSTKTKPDTKPDPSLFTAACMIVNSIDPTAEADPDTMLRVRVTTSHVVVITHRGQKFSIPIGTVKAAAQAQDVGATRETPPDHTIKGETGSDRPAKTVKKATSRKKPTTTRKDKT